MSLVLTDAVTVISTLLSGPIAIGIGTIAVAMLGFSMLTGHIEIVRVVRVIIGLFILLAAPTIAAELRGLAPGSESIKLESHEIDADIQDYQAPKTVCWACGSNEQAVND